MEHSHNHSHHVNLGNAFKIGIVINVIFIVVEVTFGFLSNSMALVSDAGHNLSDVIALAFSGIAILLSQRKPTQRYTYGLQRSTILIALLNTILLLAAVAFIVWETIEKMKNPVTINSTTVILVAAIGIVVNGATAWLFAKGNKHDLNIRSVFLHFIADALVSLGVVVAGIIMLLTGLVWIDSLISFLIIAVILYSTYKLLIDSVNMALDAVPKNIDIEAVRSYLENLHEVIGIHDLHIWALSTTDTALSVHLSTQTPKDVGFISLIQQHLRSQFNIEHSTIQLEFSHDNERCETSCDEI